MRTTDPQAGATARSNERRLRVELNGEASWTRAATLAELVEEAGYGGQRVATAVNGEFVAEPARAGTVIRDGDRVEVVAPRQGG